MSLFFTLQGIFVKTVSPDGPAVSILQEGDQLLEVTLRFFIDFLTVSQPKKNCKYTVYIVDIRKYKYINI